MALDTCLKHHFLLAMPSQRGDYFGNTITYVCEHNEEGAMGFMVNRPMKLTVADLLDQLGISRTLTREQPVMEGGPVKTERGFILHSDEVHYDASLALGQRADAEHRAPDARSNRRAATARSAISSRSATRAGAAASSKTRCSRTPGSAVPADVEHPVRRARSTNE